MTNTDTDGDKYVINGVEVTPVEAIEIITAFFKKQQFRVGRLKARIAELELGLNNQTVHSNTLQKILTEKLARIAELEADKERLNSCESALISMVNQFFYSKAGENIFRHSFMSAEEEAADYLVEHGIARWADKRKSSIYFNEVQE